MKGSLLILLIGSLVLSGCLSDSKQIQLNDHEERITDLEDDYFEPGLRYDFYLTSIFEDENFYNLTYIFEIENGFSEPIILDGGLYNWKATSYFCDFYDVNFIDTKQKVSYVIECKHYCSFTEEYPPWIEAVRFKLQDANVFAQVEKYPGRMTDHIELDFIALRDAHKRVCTSKEGDEK